MANNVRTGSTSDTRPPKIKRRNPKSPLLTNLHVRYIGLYFCPALTFLFLVRLDGYLTPLPLLKYPQIGIKMYLRKPPPIFFISTPPGGYIFQI
jgi:hypothetical protein